MSRPFGTRMWTWRHRNWPEVSTRYKGRYTQRQFDRLLDSAMSTNSCFRDAVRHEHSDPSSSRVLLAAVRGAIRDAERVRNTAALCETSAMSRVRDIMTCNGALHMGGAKHTELRPRRFVVA